MEKNCCKTVLVLLILIGVTLLIGGAVGYDKLSREHAQILERLPLSGQYGQIQTTTISYATTTQTVAVIGAMVFNNPGYDKDTWYVVSEAPGAAALAYRLAFTETSMCSTATGISQSCLLGVRFEGGTRVYVKGYLSQNTITVQEMTLFEKQ